MNRRFYVNKCLKRSLYIQLKAMSECIDEISNLNLGSDFASLNFISESLAVHLRELERIKSGALVRNESLSKAKNKPYEMSLTFQDLDADCFDAIFRHLTMREKFAVERVSKSWQKGVKKALKLQSDLIIVSNNNEKAFDGNVKCEFAYNKAAIAKVIHLLPNAAKITFVGFEIDYKKLGLVKKFPKLSGLVFVNCEITDTDTWQNLSKFGKICRQNF